MKNLTYDQLIELAPKDRPFQIEVENGNIMWAYITSSYNLWTINDSYGFNFWQTGYKGKFTLIDPLYQKPEVLKVGQKVRIMESALELDDNISLDVNEVGTIQEVTDSKFGIYYLIALDSIADTYPHYCVMPVEEEEIQERPKLKNTLEQLDNLVSKAQDIISKYKK